MTQQYQQKTVNTFVKGLVTEATELSFPENASSDELNCVLERKGNRRRRLGFDLEASASDSSYTTTATETIYCRGWDNVAGIPNLKFLAVQVGSMIYFYDKSSTPLSAGEKTFSINLTTYSAGNGESVSESMIDTAQVRGKLMIVSKAIEPILVSYDSVTDTISVEEITVRIRDFDFLVPLSVIAPDTAPAVSEITAAGYTEAQYRYDLYNMGWDTTKITTFTTGSGGPLPPRNAPWYSGKDASDNFSYAEYIKEYYGTSTAANGRVISPFKLIDRESVQAGAGTFSEPARFACISSYAGRIFYSGLSSQTNGNKILFSTVILNETGYGDCFQTADPTSEVDSDLVDSDGGVIAIQEAGNIQALFVFGASLLVFADNGIWQIRGVDSVFRATEYSVSRVSSVGLISRSSLVDVDGLPFWWSSTGIHTAGVSELGEAAREENISRALINSFFIEISNERKAHAYGAYDPIERRIYWMYGNEAQTNDHRYDKVLILDIDLGAFIPWDVSEATSGVTRFIKGVTFLDGRAATSTAQNIIVGVDNVVVGVDDVVVTGYADTSSGESSLFFPVFHNGKLTFGNFYKTDFLDWGDADYTSFVITGYEFAGDLLIQKNAPYIVVYLKRTETGWTGDETNGYSMLNPSSCLMTVRWNTANTSDSNKISQSRQVYKYRRFPVVDAGDLTSFPYGFSTIESRNKVRGRGRVLQVKFESEQGKDFNILGWETLIARNPRF